MAEKINKIKATNDFVFLLRDKEQSETKGLIIPNQGREKPNTAEIFSVGSQVKDFHIKNGVGKKCLFHKGIGFPIEYEGKEYLVLTGNEIIAVIQ